MNNVSSSDGKSDDAKVGIRRSDLAQDQAHERKNRSMIHEWWREKRLHHVSEIAVLQSDIRV